MALQIVIDGTLKELISLVSVRIGSRSEIKILPKRILDNTPLQENKLSCGVTGNTSVFGA
jgi:hypothetical protein